MTKAGLVSLACTTTVSDTAATVSYLHHNLVGKR